MLNEIQMKMLDRGYWPNRAWMSIHGKWDVKTPYLNRRQRHAIKNAPLYDKNIERVQLAVDKKTGHLKYIVHNLDGSKRATKNG
jgi:hypothetical protein